MCLTCCYTEGKLVDDYRYEAGLNEDNGIRYEDEEEIKSKKSFLYFL